VQGRRSSDRATDAMAITASDVATTLRACKLV